MCRTFPVSKLRRKSCQNIPFLNPLYTPSAERVYHLAIMPCYDKKLEASRDDFLDDILHTRDVDCVLTSGELLTFIQEHAADFVSSTEAPLDQMSDLFVKHPEIFLSSLNTDPLCMKNHDHNFEG